MTGFVSGRAVGANHDPYPWLHDHATESCHDNGSRMAWNNGVGNVYDPRPEYDVPVNPMLREFRLEADDAADWIRLYDEGGEFYENIQADFTPEQIAHARRVLTKLAALTPTTEGTA